MDTHLSPFKEYQKARSFVNYANLEKVKELLDEGDVKDNIFSISFIDTVNDEAKGVHRSGEFIKVFAEIYGNILRSDPKPHRNSQVDSICEVNREYYALVEVQVVPQNYWDKRALAYAANIHGRQLREGEQWDKIKKVICVNILGGGPDDTKWPTRTGFSRITFKNQNKVEIEEGIEV